MAQVDVVNMTVKVGDKRISEISFGVADDFGVEVKYTKCVGVHSVGRFIVTLDPKVYWRAVENNKLLDLLP